MYGSLTFLPYSNFAVFDGWYFLQYCLQGAENCTNCSSYQLFQLMNLNRTYGRNFYELSRTLMRKNVNNDVSKDSPIRHLHNSHNAPYLPSPPPPKKILHNLCSSFLLGSTAVRRENENNAQCLCKLWRGRWGGGGWQTRCIIGDVQVAYRPHIKEWQFLIMYEFN